MMDVFRLPTDKELYLSDVIWPHIDEWHSDSNHFVITKWKDGTPDEVKERSTSYPTIIVEAK